MAQIALPRQQVTQTQQSAQIGSPLYQRRRPSQAGPIELLPNPDFSFPMRDPETTSSAPTPTANARPMSLQAYPTGRRGSAHARGKSINALPDFSFNPAGTSAPPVTATSPQLSPMALPTTPVTPATPSRPIGGHRRGGSEFIGGDGRSGGASLLSTSPTKGDDILPPPPNNTLRPGPPAGRRGHAHRRSGAVSSHDLSSIMNPPAHPRAGSAPVTPSEGPQFAFGHSVNKSMSQPSLRDAGSLQDADETPRPPSRARVGFSDKVEYIRPLSTISSETETSMSTFRGHSATNSLSSVISSGTSSPQTFRNGRPTLSIVEDKSRPSTAGAILGGRGNSGDDAANHTPPSSAISPPAMTIPTTTSLPAKRRSFFKSEPRRSDPPVPTLSSVSDVALNVPVESPLPSPMVDEEENGEKSTRTKSRKSNKAPRKVKSWASSIIPKKTKHSKKVKDRASTPPPQSTGEDDSDASEDPDFEANFDVDNTVTIVSPTEDAITVPKAQTDYASWEPRGLKRVDSDTMNPVIDLDAALGPFNGTNARTQRGFAAHRRAMHSSGGVLQSHRRTESAPALVPFELRSTAAATSSTMADVFEEDEPEDDTPVSSGKSTHSEPPINEEQEDAEEPKIQVVETDDYHNGSSMNWNFNDGLGLQRNDRSRREESSEPCSPRAVPAFVPDVEEATRSTPADAVEIVEDFEEPRTSSLTHSSDSTVTAQVSGDDTKETHNVMNLSLPLGQQNLMTPDTFASSFSSPDFRSSQISLDTPRLGTAASSMTDYQAMPSPRFGEPGPELRVSVDDVPSLTSSRSTMTSAMQSAFPLPSPRQPGDRSASLCSAPSDVESRRRKRSSIASLSRLMNTGSFGERSKLSIETRPQSEYGLNRLDATQKESKKKHKRLSKLMQFWKTKESKGSSRT
ncbi:uncharacterized protein CC84DRAFT_462302 [Paraphaeosphaeria sporulosa]|uniref:Cell wall proline rich protein n=1 Tax=Paraphaeosphaeria sporulosa TaxID=1460663 RepID=A0A177CS19_9PLEO|nr:uncharacterized protein CC84DRAFT_462302 [Paraphaeosphaeria sporulosa]OAG10086.1 hypothetical protein CC84DRAFT_462302 [Paraphaeosphaeria sporulosa]